MQTHEYMDVVKREDVRTEQKAAVDSGQSRRPRAFGFGLMGLFGVPPPLDAE